MILEPRTKAQWAHRTEDPPLEELMLETNEFPKQINKIPHKMNLVVWTKIVNENRMRREDLNAVRFTKQPFI